MAKYKILSLKISKMLCDFAVIHNLQITSLKCSQKSGTLNFKMLGQKPERNNEGGICGSAGSFDGSGASGNSRTRRRKRRQAVQDLITSSADETNTEEETGYSSNADEMETNTLNDPNTSTAPNTSTNEYCDPYGQFSKEDPIQEVAGKIKTDPKEPTMLENEEKLSLHLKQARIEQELQSLIK